MGESGLLWYVEWAGCPDQDDLKNTMTALIKTQLMLSLANKN